MTSNPDTGQSQDSDSEIDEETIEEAVQEAIDDWVASDEIPVYRTEGKIVADKDVLRQNILVMVAIAVDQTAD